MQNLVIVGTGLIGSSFGLALRQAGFTGAITGVSSPHAIAEALSRGAVEDRLAQGQSEGRTDQTSAHNDDVMHVSLLRQGKSATRGRARTRASAPPWLPGNGQGMDGMRHHMVRPTASATACS